MVAVAVAPCKGGSSSAGRRSVMLRAWPGTRRPETAHESRQPCLRVGRQRFAALSGAQFHVVAANWEMSAPM